MTIQMLLIINYQLTWHGLIINADPRIEAKIEYYMETNPYFKINIEKQTPACSHCTFYST